MSWHTVEHPLAMCLEVEGEWAAIQDMKLGEMYLRIASKVQVTWLTANPQKVGIPGIANT